MATHQPTGRAYLIYVDSCLVNFILVMGENIESFILFYIGNDQKKVKLVDRETKFFFPLEMTLEVRQFPKRDHT